MTGGVDLSSLPIAQTGESLAGNDSSEASSTMSIVSASVIGISLSPIWTGPAGALTYFQVSSSSRSWLFHPAGD